MIITRTPLRISFFGGGTDYPDYFRENGGAVIGTTIDKYIYTTARHLPPFFKHKSRIVWSMIETVRNFDEIVHPSVKACLKYLKIKKGVEIHYDADIPSRSGLGSSSAFTVGLLHSLSALNGKMITKEKLAQDALKIEIEILKENVGFQDQILTSFGGLNLIEFLPDKSYKILPVITAPGRLESLEKHLVLIFSGFSRIASRIAGDVIKNIPRKQHELKELHKLVFEAFKILTGNKEIKDFGRLLNETWKLKRALSNKISISVVDEIYETALKKGAVGGKLLGAGGGGFILLFVEPDKRHRVLNALNKFLHIPIKFENLGSHVIFHHPEIQYE